jgi:micrococcal nuclease
MEQRNKVLTQNYAEIIFDPIKGNVLAMSGETPEILYSTCPHSGELITLAIWVCFDENSTSQSILIWGPETNPYINLQIKKVQENYYATLYNDVNGIQIPPNIWTFLQGKILLDTDFGEIQIRKDSDQWTTLFEGDTSTLLISDFNENLILGNNYAGKIGWCSIWNQDIDHQQLLNFSQYKSLTGKRDYSRETYEYRAEIIRVIDGDTVRANIDLGFDVMLHDIQIRMARIDAPPLHTAKGQQAKSFVQNKIEFFEVKIRTFKDIKEKYGRYIAEIYYYTLDGHMICLNDKLVQENLANYVDW